MTAAAEELFVTPGALSHQIRGLEAFLEVTLFERLPRGIALTSAGRILYPGLESGFQQVRGAVAALRRAELLNVLVLSTPPGLTAKWLAPRLYRFIADNPDMDVRISSSIRNADFVTDGVDLAIRNLPAESQNADGLAVELLARIEYLAVCTPDIAARFDLYGKPENVAKAPLIHDDTFMSHKRMLNWEDWFKAAQVQMPAGAHGMHFNSADHALDAAAQGAGVLLAHNIMAHDDLQSGRLVSPIDLNIKSGRGYFLVGLEGVEERPSVAKFHAWILEEIEAMESADALCAQAD
jgi:LysR family glycine cleavage system transcriptional activator